MVSVESEQSVSNDPPVPERVIRGVAIHWICCTTLGSTAIWKMPFGRGLRGRTVVSVPHESVSLTMDGSRRSLRGETGVEKSIGSTGTHLSSGTQHTMQLTINDEVQRRLAQVGRTRR